MSNAHIFGAVAGRYYKCLFQRHSDRFINGSLYGERQTWYIQINKTTHNQGSLLILIELTTSVAGETGSLTRARIQLSKSEYTASGAGICIVF